MSPTWRAVPAVSGIGVPMRVAVAPVASTTVAVRVPRWEQAGGRVGRGADEHGHDHEQGHEADERAPGSPPPGPRPGRGGRDGDGHGRLHVRDVVVGGRQ